jgi:hypothetical protein
MTLSRQGLRIGVPLAWAAAWALWLASGAASPVPPWSARQVLAREERAAQALLKDPRHTPFWSAVGGGIQRQAFGVGWGAVEAHDGRRCVPAVLPVAEIVFASPAWDGARLAMTVRAAEAGGPESVVVAIDGRALGAFDLGAGWTEAAFDAGPLGAGRHRIEVRAAQGGVCVAAVAAGRFGDRAPAVDAGFVQWLPLGAAERPVFFPSDKRPPARGHAFRWAGLEGVHAFATPAVDGFAAWLEVVHGLSAAALLVFATGLPLACRLAQGLAARAVAALGLSALGLVTVFVALRGLGVPPEAGPLAAGLFLFGAAGLVAARRETLRLSWRLLLPALATAAPLAFFALRVVPPLDDQDLEVQATAHALATRQEPVTVTDRGTTYFFAHPPLLHVVSAGSLALAGRLSRVADAEQLARRGQVREAFVEPAYDDYPPRYYDLWWELLERFYREPELWPTRAVNVLLTAMAAGWLAELAARLAQREATAWLVALVFASFPEILVRGAYGGYFSLTVFTSLGVLAALHERGQGALLASGLAVLANQKGLLVPVAWLIAAPRGTPPRGRLGPVLAGAAALALFAAWGLAVDAPTFLYDFVKEHVARRLSLQDVRLAHDAGVWYPSIPELWREFVAHYGPLFAALAAFAVLRGLRHEQGLARLASVAVLTGAVVFSLTDWRQTKHLSLIVAPALLAVAACEPRGGRGRRLFHLLLIATIAWNLVTGAALVADFGALQPSTIW